MKKDFKNIQAEKAFLANIFQGYLNLNDAGDLNPDDFYDAFHRLIFSTIIENRITDPIQIREKIKESDIFDEERFTEIIMTDGIDFTAYAKIIKENSINRQKISILEDLESGKFDATEALEKIKEIEKEKSISDKDYFEIEGAKNIKGKEPEFLLKNFLPIPEKALTIISAKGGAGKSALALQIALRASQNMKVFAWLSEDAISITKYRLDKIELITKLNVNNNLVISSKRPFHIAYKNGRSLQIHQDFNRLKSACSDFNLIIIDPLIAFYGGEENNNSEARFFMDLLSDWAKEKTIILIHHTAKIYKTEDGNFNTSRGAGAFVDAARAHYHIKKYDQDNRFVVPSLEKDNWGISRFYSPQPIQIFKDFYKEVENNEEEEQYETIPFK